ncbi:hypothetical protein QFC22_000443 [Naganishia vaughanmartiniae]|uniref:Uncharacterized protein n=1 Tax=Naganishia vaughanmartiniae TaxID=1424756 RepID=A0ACC2XNC6_9TREE|nr:hypothetical protein QFC22_000443 [Naganishia vaughanmartiniae]
MQSSDYNPTSTEHTFLRPQTPGTASQGTNEGVHKRSTSSASQGFAYSEPFHIRNDSNTSIAQAGPVGFDGSSGFEGVSFDSGLLANSVEEGSARFSFGGSGVLGGLWSLNTAGLCREEPGSSLTSPVSTITTNAESVAGGDNVLPSSTNPQQSHEDIDEYFRAAQQHYQQAQQIQTQIDSQVQQTQQVQQQQQSRGRSVSQPSHFSQLHRFSMPFGMPSDPATHSMDSSPIPISTDHSSNISAENSRNLGSSPLQGLDQHAYFPQMGPPGAHAGQMNAGMQSSQAKNTQVEQHIAMMNAMNGMNGQLAADGQRVLPSQPGSPNANHPGNGMMTFSTPAGISNPTQQVHTRPRGMTVGTVPVFPLQFVNYQPALNPTSINNGGMHATPESMFQMSTHQPRTQGPSPVPASPFNAHPRDGMIARTAPSSPGSQMFAQEIENKAFMNAALTTPQRVMSANFTLQEAPRSLHDYNPVPTLETQAMAYGRGMSEIKMTPIPMSVSNSQTSFAPANYLPGSAGSAEDNGGSKSRMGSRRSSITGLQMNPPNGSQEMQTSSGQQLTITTDSSQVEELSHDLRDKLSFLTNLQNKLTAAINEAQLNHPMAVDEYLNDIKKAIVSKENEPRTPSSAASGSGQITSFSASIQRQPSPLVMRQTLNNRLESITPINITLGSANMPNPGAQEAVGNAQRPGTGSLLAPVELSRATASSSVKRAAPESPMLEAETAGQTKYMRLEQSMDGIEPSASTSTQQQSMMPQMVHAHSYPHAGPVHQPMMAVPMNAMPTLTGALPQHIPLTHTPVNPSPLSHVSNANQGVPFAFGLPAGMPMPMDPAMQNWTNQQLMADGNYMIPPLGQIQQPITVGRRGSIVDGRLIAPRPRVGDARSITTGAIPTMTTLGMTSMMSQQPNMSNFQFTGMDSEIALEDGDLEDEEDSDEDEGPLKRRPSKRRRSSDQQVPEGALVQPPDLISDEIRLELDKIMYEFLNDICSDLGATDAKGELIHQPLMKKKMERLDASTDFRPFKFRIQAFTNAFSELLQRKGILEETLPAKKIKSYLWNQKLISRFNDDGKKSKSKGNHIWNVDAKRLPDGQWIFRPFQRKIHLPDPLHAWYGSKFAWQPKVWDPQASTSGLKVEWRFDGLPSWLKWREDVKGLEGIPMEGDSSADITVTAVFLDTDGKELAVSTRFFLPVDHLEASNAAATITPAGLMLSAMNGAGPSNAPQALNSGLSEVKQEPAGMHTSETPMREISDMK